MKSNQIAVFSQFGRKYLFAAALMMGAWFGSVLGCFAQPGNMQFHSKWDENMLNVELHDVNVKANFMTAAWEDLSRTHLLRFNLYMDAKLDGDSAPFSFKKEKATGKELLEAFLAAYPAYTYTQSAETGVIWIHRKAVDFDRILDEKIIVEKEAIQVPMYNGIYEPLCRLVASRYPIADASSQSQELAGTAEYNYPVDLPAGEYTFRRILDFCCVQNPGQVFAFSPWVFEEGRIGTGGSVRQFIYRNPMAPPRPLAVAYWDAQVGKVSNGVPRIDDIGTALACPDPRIRTAALRYLEVTHDNNYNTMGLVKTNSLDDMKKTDWAMLELKTMNIAPDSPKFPVISNTNAFWVMMSFTNNLAQADPGLALLISMELAREKNEPDLMDCVTGHKFTQAEIAVIKPDVYRIARQSKLVRDKLIEMKFDAPELSPESLRELENTNFFRLVPEEKIR